jgi:hypothetical protein
MPGDDGSAVDLISAVFGPVADVAGSYFTAQTAAQQLAYANANADYALQRQYAREDAARSFTQQLTGTKWGYAVVAAIGLAVVAVVMMKKGR